jgi:MYXO-CTERM domain-containing protein
MRSLLPVICIAAVSALPAVASAQTSAHPIVSLTVSRPTYEVDYGSGVTGGKAELALTMTSGCSGAKAVYYTWIVSNGDNERQTNISDLYEGPNLDETKILEVTPGAIYSAQFEVWCCPPEVENCDSATGDYGIATSQPVSVVPYVQLIAYRLSDMQPASCLRPGDAARVNAMVDTAPNTYDRNESIALFVRGAGVDQQMTLENPYSADLNLTPSQAGKIEVYAVLNPAGLESAHQTLEVSADCASGSSSPSGSGENSGGDDDGGDGCATAGGGLVSGPIALLALALLAMRRRRG